MNGDELPSGEDGGAITRRQWLQTLGAGLLVAIVGPDLQAQNSRERRDQRGGGRERGAGDVAARLHIARDGTITIMTGKVECGQGARAQITQAAAEELHVAPERITLVMGDTDLCPDDGPTVGSRTTPRTIPSIRQATVAARNVLIELAAARWGVDANMLRAEDGAVVHAQDGRSISYGELVDDDLSRALAAATPAEGVQLTEVKRWTVLGTSVGRPNARDIVVGTHQYPSDIERPGMLYGQVLRPPAIGAKLASINLAATGNLPREVVVVRDGNFVGAAAPRSYQVRHAMEMLSNAATWQHDAPADSAVLFDHLRRTAREPEKLANPLADRLERDRHALRQTYQVAYVQHAPLEPRAAVAEWADGKLTVWTATQNPLRVRGELESAFDLPAGSVRVIVPDFGGAFGGKHTGECAVEAARLAKAAARPVSLRWTRQEEFTWASFRPAALIMAEAGLDDAGEISSWFFVNVNSGSSGLRSPYRAKDWREEHVEANAPLRHGSYRALAATANHFARESFIDELAHAAGIDPLQFRLDRLNEPRQVNVLKAAADKFDWARRRTARQPNVGVGLACGTEKGSFVATCVEVATDPASGTFTIRHIHQAYECGKIMNPNNLLAQVQGGLIQALGPALWEAINLRDGRVLNDHFGAYRVPRFSDVPPITIDLLDRPDLSSVGAGETPVITIAPAIANAIFHACGQRVRQMPIRLPTATGGQRAASAN
ncbi:MAG TPA: molybdopterin cofactor-binding domain-containing protein [Tepidisphaeraceae bacterium]|jgi:isoquinoline 1-oxidoreductase|nr:molybdopterin cofactor-binding domain-containing protein [Tepidisphaeraceae bacterium]